VALTLLNLIVVSRNLVYTQDGRRPAEYLTYCAYYLCNFIRVYRLEMTLLYKVLFLEQIYNNYPIVRFDC
jgi:hypothetical protein